MSESTKKKRRGKAVTPDKQSPRSSAFAKKTAVETLNSPVPSRHGVDVDMRSQPARSRPASPAAVPSAITPAVKATPAPKPSGRFIDEDYDDSAADALMGLAGYKGTKEANGTSYIPIARAVSEARTEATPATKRSDAPQGHKRAISSTEDAVDSDAKKARLNSPDREKPASLALVAPVSKPVSPAAPASELPAAPTEPVVDKSKDTVPNQEKDEVVKAPSPKSPEPDVITEAVSGNTIAVQGPPAVAEPGSKEGSSDEAPATEPAEKPVPAEAPATSAKVDAPSESTPVPESTSPKTKAVEESQATPMEVEPK